MASWSRPARPTTLRRSYGATVVSLHVQTMAAPTTLGYAIEDLRQLGGVTDVTAEPAADASHVLAVSHPGARRDRGHHRRHRALVRDRGRAIRETSLDEAFLSLTGRELRD